MNSNIHLYDFGQKVIKTYFWRQTCSENIFVKASFTLDRFEGNLHLFVHVQCDIFSEPGPVCISVQKSYQTHGLAPGTPRAWGGYLSGVHTLSFVQLEMNGPAVSS